MPKENTILYHDRITGKVCTENVYGFKAVRLLYGEGWLSLLIGRPLAFLAARSPIFSALYGWWQKTGFTKKKIVPFINNYHVDPSEFLEPIDTFKSFNDFFIRKLKPQARPIAPGQNVAVIPADGRYLFFQNLAEADGFVVKGQRFDLGSFLQNESLAKHYNQGSMVIARLCPMDYHRFHFPCDGIPGPVKILNGWLYSVNPQALKWNIEIFSQNKRAVCEFQTEHFGKVLLCEVGATNVGSIIETYVPGHKVLKGEEKGYFSFGASALVLLFPPKSILFDLDLTNYSPQKNEIRCLMGQSMGIHNF